MEQNSWPGPSSLSTVADTDLAWDEDVGWYNALTGDADDLAWDWEAGEWYDPLAQHKAFELEWARLDAEWVPRTPWGWLRLEAIWLLDDFKMWMRNETYTGRGLVLKMRREDRKLRLQAYFNDLTQFLARVFLRRPAA